MIMVVTSCNPHNTTGHADVHVLVIKLLHNCIQLRRYGPVGTKTHTGGRAQVVFVVASAYTYLCFVHVKVANVVPPDRTQDQTS